MLDVRWHQPLARDLVPPYSASRLKQLEVQRLGRRLYSEVWEYQKNLMEQRKKGRILDTLILVEHEPVYTLGKNGDENHLLQSRRREIPVFRTERGGDVTYHGPAVGGLSYSRSPRPPYECQLVHALAGGGAHQHAG